MYKLFFHLIFKRMDPEKAHHLAFRWIRLAVRIPVLRTFVAAALAPRYKELRTEALGLRMHGPFGLAAGFDKNAVAVDGMAMLGFGHVEIGTVTAQPQPGNPKKRLFRLVAGPRADQPHGLQQRGLRGRRRAPGRPHAGLPDRRRRQHRQDQGRPGGGGRRRLRDVHRAARRRTPTTSSSTSPRRTRPGCATSRPPRRCARC